MQEKMSENVYKMIKFAQKEGQKLKHEYIGTGHLLLGLLNIRSCTATTIFSNLNIDVPATKKYIEKLLGVGNNTIHTTGDIPFNNRVKMIFNIAKRNAWRMGEELVGTEHFLIAFMELEEGIAYDVLVQVGLSFNILQREVSMIKRSKNTSVIKTQSVIAETVILNQFTRDLTYYAKIEALDPVIGRNKEIERVIQILARRTKNNAILIGDAGVGKTAIIEGLAERIVTGSVPDVLQRKRVISLDIVRVIAGTKYRGEFEERLKNIIDEIKKHKDTVLLFVDEMHTLIGAGGAEGAIDASNILKPVLSRGDLQCIGATTLTEYKKHIEHDPALERRFQPVMINPPSKDETIDILKGIKSCYEQHHNVCISDGAIFSAVELADRYITARFFPDKAIDLIDEASASVRIKQYQKEVTNKIVELPVVKEEDIAFVVSQWTGIPIARINEQEADKLLKMEAFLQEEIVGQNEALHSLSQAIRRSRTGFKDPNKPIGVFMFLGPSGVGKTKCAKVLAKFLFGAENSLVKCDMSEYMERHSVSRLIGAPPGYVGYEEGGQLTEAVRKNAYTVVLIDEIEKAHRDVCNVLLQVFDEGFLTDGLGHKVDFRNTVIIMTSNIATGYISKGVHLGFHLNDNSNLYENIKTEINDKLRQEFNPEFLNRIDDIILFKHLYYEDVKQILNIFLKDVTYKIEKAGYKIEIGDEVKDRLLKEGYNEKDGVRPLKRVIERLVEDSIVDGILRNKYKSGSHIVLKIDNNKIITKLKNNRTLNTKQSCKNI